MFSSPHGFLRTTDEDDAAAFHALYDAAAPRFALLDLKRETIDPTLAEVREILSSKEAARSQSFTLELANGEVAGFLVLRGLNQENGICELAVLMCEEATANDGGAAWALDIVLKRAFEQYRLRRVTTHTLCREDFLARFLEASGFTCEGRQREVVFSGGRWMDLTSYALANAAFDSTEGTRCP